MPTYDYRVCGTSRTYEVKHRMALKAATWGELCEIGGLEPGDTPLDTPVERLLSAAGVVGSRALRNPAAPPCGQPNGCSGGACGFSGFN